MRYSWSLDTLKTSEPTRVQLLKDIQTAYSGSILASDTNITWILNVPTNTTTPSAQTKALASSVIANNLGISSNQINNNAPIWSCLTQPSYTNTSFIVWAPTSIGQSWQNTNAWNPCYYVCTNWYTGSSCNIAPNLYATCIWVNNPTPFSAITTYAWCDTADITVCSWAWTWYTISACNVWTNISWLTSASYWKYFQWWRNKWFIYWNTSLETTTIIWSIWLNAITDTYWFVKNSISPQSWASTDIINNWWHTTDTNISRQWPCSAWYHIPSENEWAWIVWSWQWWSNWNAMKIALQLPASGNRNIWDANYYDQLNGAYYWSSGAFSNVAFYIKIDTINIYNHSVTNRWMGLSVRCIRNN